MFMVSRRVGERIVIGGTIAIEITKITRGGVRLGITAPREQMVVRGEVWEAIVKANREAASISVDAADELAALGRSEPVAPREEEKTVSNEGAAPPPDEEADAP